MKKSPVEFTCTELTQALLPRTLDGLRICHMSDFHSSRFADHGELIAQKVREFAPELILVTGDMADCSKDRSAEYFFSVADRLAGFPMVCSPGNHELRIGKQKMPPALQAAFAERQIPLLYNERAEIAVRGTPLLLFGYLQGFRWFTERGEKRARLRQDITERDLALALGECPRSRFSVLLAHDPAPFAAYADWGTPLVLSGHIHGGQIRLPRLGGMLSPAHRFFPEYSAGVYRRGSSTLVVSRGLSVSEMPRINNRPEVAFLILRNEKLAEQSAQAEAPSESGRMQGG
ncbi:MAG: metallophosphoesterase [Firmicutes bacterium]|nr:metallophosphoesterase [Bacillota bacterium]